MKRAVKIILLVLCLGVAGYVFQALRAQPPADVEALNRLASAITKLDCLICVMTSCMSAAGSM